MLISPSKKRKKDNRIKVRKKVKNLPLVTPPSLEQIQCVQQFQEPQKTSQPQQLPRQRIDLKGPRVKHVCRSASVALGQPMATFPGSEAKEDCSDASKNIPKLQNDCEKPDKKEEQLKEKEPSKNNQDPCNLVAQPQPKRSKVLQSNSMSRALPKPQVNETHTISIDFWEQYDPEEVGAKGFALIGSELFHIPAICYLCGSAGKEPVS